jgi:hypothetical protein
MDTYLTSRRCALSRKSVAFFLLTASCSGTPERNVSGAGDGSEDGENGDPVVDAGVAAVDAGRPMRDASRLDAARPPAVLARECTPGRYEGEFNCVISGLLPWVGKIGFDLVEQEMNAGEFLTLTIVPGTRIMGSDDSLDGMFTADLEGDFDCRTGALTGRLANGVYLFGGFMEYQLEGPLQGTYRTDGGAPGFDGTMGKLTSPTFEAFGDLGPSAMCTWTATQVDKSLDAGP